MKLPEIVGISGTNGAGKDELGRLLAERKGYYFHSVSDLLRNELRRQGKEITRENQGALSKQWRVESGDDGIMFQKAIEEYLAQKAENGWKGLALVSIRHPSEVTTIHNYDGVMIWVDADQRTRYERAVLGNRTGREDNVGQTFEQFQADEYREMHPPEGAPRGTLDMAGARSKADIVVQNDFATVKEYQDYLVKEFEL